MKNVIMILLDSVISDCLGQGRTKESSTPFIDRLINDGVYVSNVFSNGPYTDAATKALYTGEPTLDNYGYYYQLNNANNNIYRVFHDSGYETYGFYYPYYLISSDIKKKIDHSVYLSGMIYSSTWNGKLSYYAEVAKKRKLTSTEYCLITKLLELQFESWNNFYTDLMNDIDSSRLIYGNYTKKKLFKSMMELENEKRRFDEAPYEYIDGVLKNGLEHPLAKLDCVDTDAQIDKKFIKSVFKNNSNFFKKAKQVEKVNNFKNNHFSIKKVLYGLGKSVSKKDTSELRYLVNYVRCLCSFEEMEKIAVRDKWQLIVSARRQTRELLSMLDKHDGSRPFFASLHFLEAHNSISCFTYDVQDEKLVNEEIKTLYRTLNGVGPDFRGNLLYQLALTYIDMCIEELVNGLKDKEMLDDTMVVLVADHGSSYSYYPVRNHVVNTFHVENYKTPFIMWNCNDKKRIDKNCLWSAIDVLPTILTNVGLEVPISMKGANMLESDSTGRSYIITEYMGPGCPDMLSRDIWLSVRNTKFVVGVKHPINKEYQRSSIYTIYNLIDDENEIDNIVDTVEFDNELVEIEKIIQKRISEIQENVRISVSRIMKNNSV